MGRIRLQVRVPPWQESASSSHGAQARQNDNVVKPIKVVVSCDENATLQDLNDKVVERWADIYVGYGTLRIKHFETYFGEVLATYDKVGEYFDDRSTDDTSKDDGVPKTSIALVHRLPPDPTELHNVRRFGSLMPESAAIPKKRLPIDAIEGYQNGFVRWGTQQSNGTQKRHKTQGMRHNGTPNPDRPITSREHHMDGPYSSQAMGTQGSIHQVIDSQRSPRMKYPNPYDTPTSLSLISPQEQVPIDRGGMSMIPDSPTGRGARIVRRAFGTAMDLDRESQKSESPELDLSVHEVPSMDVASAPIEDSRLSVFDVPSDMSVGVTGTMSQTDCRLPASGSSITPFVTDLTPKSKLNKRSIGDFAGQDHESERQTVVARGVTSYTPSKRKQPCAVTTIGGEAINGKRGDIYDPIESDTESFHEKQRMHSGKRLKLNHVNPRRSISPRVLLSSSKDRRKDGFLVPPLPVSRDNRMRVPLGEIPVDGNENERVQGNNTVDEHNIQDQSQPDNSEQVPQEQSAASGSQKTYQRFSKPTTTEPQSLENRTNNGKLPGDENRQRTRAVSESDNRDEVTSSPDLQCIQEAERPTPEELAEAERFSQTKTDIEGPAGTNRLQGELEQEKQQGELQKTVERLAQKRRSREKALSEQAEKMLLAADGAKVLETAKLERKSAGANSKAVMPVPKGTDSRAILDWETAQKDILPPVSSNSEVIRGASKPKGLAPVVSHLKEIKINGHKTNGATPNAPKVTNKPTTRNEQPKARRVDLAAVGKGESWEEGQALQKATEHSPGNIEGAGRGAEQSSQQAKVEGKEKGVKRQVTPMLERAVQNYRALSQDRSRQASTPSEASNITVQNRKSMTPAIPRSSIAKPSSNRSGTSSSSPLASRSSNSLETPLRSALKQGSTALRRSVSFIDKPEDCLPKPKTSILSAPSNAPPNIKEDQPFKTLVDINRELASTAPFLKNASSRAIPRNGTGSKVAETNVARKGKVQAKLNVTRNVKKGKEREIANPTTPKPSLPQQVEISSSSDSDSASSFLSEEAVGRNGSSKAGPSSRLSRRRMIASAEKVAAREKASDNLIDPELRKIKVEKDTAVAVTLPPESNSISISIPKQKSNSRSPAQVLSGTVSPTSESASNSEDEVESDSDERSESSSENSSSSSSIHEADTRNGKENPGNIRGLSKPVSMETFSPNAVCVAQSSQRSSKSVKQKANSVATNGNPKHIDPAVGAQLRRESDHPTHTTPSIAATGECLAEEKPLKSGLKVDRHGRLPNGIRPANYRYPRLSELSKMAKAESIHVVSSTSQGSVNTSGANSESSSSSSEDESSSSEDDEVANGSQAKSKSTPGRIPGFKGVMKLARMVRGVGP